MIQAIGYIRRSTDTQEESLEQQRAKLEEFAHSHGWKLVRVYADDAISGSELHRPGLRQLLEDAGGSTDIGVVVTWDRNRLARPKDPIDGLLLERRLIETGKRVVYAGTGQETDRSFTSGLISYVEHYQNGDYLRKLSRDTIRGVVNRVKRGLWPGGAIPFGYDRLILDEDGTLKHVVRDVEDGSQVVLDSTSSRIVERLPKGRRHRKQEHELCTLTPSDASRIRAVQRIFAEYASGKPIRRLRDDLNASGFRSSRGGLFTIQTIHPMLDNPAYVGRCVYNRRTWSKWHRYENGSSVERLDEGVERRPESDWIVVENAWPALVGAGTFEAVQQRRKESRDRQRHVTGRAICADYLLSGIFVCGVCGAKMSGQTCTSGKGYRTRYYVCGAHHAGLKDRCPTRYSVPADFVEQHILGLIRADLEKLRDDDQLHEYVTAEVNRMLGGRSDARHQHQRRLAELDQQVAKLRDHLLALDLDTARSLGLYDQARSLAAERDLLDRELRETQEPLAGLPDAATLRERAAAEFDRLDAVLAGGTLEERRELVRLYVQQIKADPTTQTVQISLYPALFSSRIEGTPLSSSTLLGACRSKPGEKDAANSAHTIEHRRPAGYVGRH